MGECFHLDCICVCIVLSACTDDVLVEKLKKNVFIKYKQKAKHDKEKEKLTQVQMLKSETGEARGAVIQDITP